MVGLSVLSPSLRTPQIQLVRLSFGKGGTTDVDAVFLEDRDNFPGAQHVRRDLAEATLLNGTFQFLRFGGDMAGRSSYAEDNAVQHGSVHLRRQVRGHRTRAWFWNVRVPAAPRGCCIERVILAPRRVCPTALKMCRSC